MIAQYPIGGNDTGYDYLRVDALARRVFVAHANRVEVLNVDTGEKLGEIAGMHGVHGIELIAELGKGYTSNGLDRTVTVFDRDTLKIRKVIRYTGVKPDAIQWGPAPPQLPKFSFSHGFCACRRWLADDENSSTFWTTVRVSHRL